MNIKRYKNIILLLFFFQTFIEAQYQQTFDLTFSNVLIKHYLSLTIGRREKLYTNLSNNLEWYSTDTNIVTVYNSIAKGKCVGTAYIIAKNKSGSMKDSCAVSVVPWVAGVTNLKMEPYLSNLDLLTIRNDTLYMQGAGNDYSWRDIYIYRGGTNSPKSISDFINNGKFPFDREYLLATPFDDFVIAKRESVNASRKIYKIDPDGHNIRLVYDKFPPYPLKPNGSYVMQQGWDFDEKGNIYLGEYNQDTSSDYQIRIYKGSNFGENWRVVYTFPPRSNGANDGGIRHVHACQVDPYTGYIWVATGDASSQSRIYYHENQFLPDIDGKVRLKLLGVGSQEFRVVSFAFTKNYIYWFMDAPCNDQKIFRIKRADSYYTLTPNTPSDSDYREVLGVFKDKSFRNSITISNSHTNTILVSTVYENVAQYGCTFRELDKRDRIFAIREDENGTVQIQEIFSIPALMRYAEIRPIGLDSQGYIYFYSNNISDTNRIQTFRAKLGWNDEDDVSVSMQDSVINFPNTSLRLYAHFHGENRAIADRIITGQYFGKIPNGIRMFSPFYWEIYFNADTFNNGKICIPLSKISPFSMKDSLVWLARSDPDDDWMDVGGMARDGYFYSTHTFSNVSQFIIGSYKENIILPDKFVLFQNYPNPFNNSTIILFDLPVNGFVSLKIYDLLGSEVLSLINGQLEPGSYRRDWDASNVASGVYICNLNIKSTDCGTVYSGSLKLLMLK